MNIELLTMMASIMPEEELVNMLDQALDEYKEAKVLDDKEVVKEKFKKLIAPVSLIQLKIFNMDKRLDEVMKDTSEILGAAKLIEKMKNPHKN